MEGGGREWREGEGEDEGMDGRVEGDWGISCMLALVLDMHPSKLLAQRVGTC